MTPGQLTQAVRDAERALDQATQARDNAIRAHLNQDGVTHEQTAALFGVSRQRVSQLAQRIRRAA